MLTILPWAFAINKSEPDYWHYFFWVEHIHRFLSENAQHKAPFWYYIPTILFGAIPWSGFLPSTLIHSWQQRKINQDIFFLFCWFIMPLIFFSISKGKLVTYVLPVMAPIALMIANYVIYCITTNNFGPIKFNGCINITIGIVLIIIYLITWLFGFYTPMELYKLILGVIIFTIWILISYLSILAKARYWLFVSLCSISLSLLIQNILPQDTIDSKLPQKFIREYISLLANSRFILASNIGLATGLAWELKQDNIYLYETSGELQYGLNYSNSNNQYRVIKQHNISKWVNNVRKIGQLSIIILLRRNEDIPIPNIIPKPDFWIRNTRMVILVYGYQP